MGTGHSVFQFDPPGLENEQGRMLSDAEQRARKTLTSYNGRIFPKTFYAESSERKVLEADGGGNLWEYFFDVRVELMLPPGRRLAVQVVAKSVEAGVINACTGFGQLGARVGFASDAVHPVTQAGIGASALWRPNDNVAAQWFSTTSHYEYNATYGQSFRVEPTWLGQAAYVDPLAGYDIEHDTQVAITAIGSFGTNNGDFTGCAGNEGKIHIEGLRMWVHQM